MPCLRNRVQELRRIQDRLDKMERSASQSLRGSKVSFTPTVQLEDLKVLGEATLGPMKGFQVEMRGQVVFEYRGLDFEIPFSTQATVTAGPVQFRNLQTPWDPEFVTRTLRDAISLGPDAFKFMTLLVQS